MDVSAHLMQEHGIETAHQLKNAVPADCAESEDCPGTLSALMNNANGAEITQNGLRFLQKEYDEKGLTHPDDQDDTEAGEFTSTKTRSSKRKKKKKEVVVEEEEEENANKKDAHKTQRAPDPVDLADKAQRGADPLAAELTPERQQQKDL